MAAQIATLSLFILATGITQPSAPVCVSRPPQALRSTLPVHTLEIALAGGPSYGDVGAAPSRLGIGGMVTSLSVVVPVSDRLSWPTLPALAYRFGDPGGFEWITWAGMYSWGIAFQTGERVNARVGKLKLGTIAETQITAYLGAGLDARWWISESMSLNISSGSLSSTVWSPKKKNRIAPKTWRQNLSLGVSYTYRNRLTIHLGIGAEINWVDERGTTPWAFNGKRFALAFGLGSIQSRGMRPLPLLQIHLTRHFSLDIYAATTWMPSRNTHREIFMLGGTFLLSTHPSTTDI